MSDLTLKRGTAQQQEAYTGAQGELTVDTTLKTVRTHDGLGPGGTSTVPLRADNTIDPALLPLWDQPNQPAITNPLNGERSLLRKPVLTSTAFSIPGNTDTHVASQWQIAEDSEFLNVVWDSGEVPQLTSITVDPPLPNLATEYHIRVRHRGNATGWSTWSDAVTARTIETVPGEQIFTTPGTFTVPAGVFAVSVVCIGSGGQGLVNYEPEGGGSAGAGGGNGWRNNIAVVPGQTINVTAGGLSTSSFGIHVSAGAGAGGGGIGGQPVGHEGGGAGGNGGGGPPGTSAGGGGAGGYLGNGGNGNGGSPAVGSGAGAGGAGAGGFASGGLGGGVGLFGHGPDGVPTGTNGGPGSNGSGNLYGGGAGGGGSTASLNGAGAVRVIWGDNRSFPYNAA